MIVSTVTTPKPCRRAICPAISPAADAAGAASGVPPSVDGDEIVIRKGDTIDVGILWDAWLKANDASITASSWAADASSPKAPTVTANGIDAPRGETIAILDASAATVGDVYVINNTITVADTSPASGAGGYTIPARTVTRCIHVRVAL